MSTPVQRSLFDVPATPPYRRKRDTSVAAADAVRGVAETRRAEVIHWLTVRGRFGATVSELMYLMGVTERNTTAPRVSQLASEKYGSVVCDSGRRRRGRGRRCGEIVWVLSTYGGSE